MGLQGGKLDPGSAFTHQVSPTTSQYRWRCVPVSQIVSPAVAIGSFTDIATNFERESWPGPSKKTKS